MSDRTKLTEVITRCHKELDELFLLHQEAVLLGRFDEAMQLLICFENLHHLHMTFEDEKLIPKLHKLGNRGRWPASLYTDEHGKVKELLRKTKSKLSSLGNRRLSNQASRREIIDFLDRERTFKGLCEHHQEREETGMLPELDKQTSEEWRAAIIEPFLKEWNCRMKHTTEAVNGMDFS